MERRPFCLLPDNVAPSKYKVRLAPEPNFEFSGNIEISLQIRKPTKEIVMHASELGNFRTVKLSSMEDGWTREPIEPPRIDTRMQTLTLNFGEIIPFGLAKLHVKYSGAINDQLCGLYRSIYDHPDGSKRYLATSQCEAIDARKIFPCFDEPRWKAIIELTVDMPASLTAVSNMPIGKIDTLPLGFKRVNFLPTPPMSTYLFALLIGELNEEKWLKGKTKDGVLVRIITVPGKEKLGKYALRRAIRTLNFYTNYYRVPYPLPKCDLGAVPDFAAGAMENWGFDIFREPALLADPKNTSSARLERIELVVDHELGHQWHGDIVTMPWWDGIALNEAFATWTELLVARNLDPHKGAEEKFVAEDLAGALHADASAYTRPVFVPVDHPDEIGEVFDAITYSKGGSSIRMIENFVSPEKFRDAMRVYIPRHAYGLATQKDLWAAVEEIAGAEVVKMADAWFNKPGYPVLLAEKTANGYLVSQSRFLYERNETLEGETKWIVPMRVRTGDRPDEVRTYILEGATMEIHDLPRDQWIVWNGGATGFYRVYYDTNDLLRLCDAMQAGEIASACERIAIVDDIAALTTAGYYSAKTPFDFYKAFKSERHLRVWQVVLAGLSGMTSLFARETYSPRMDKFVRDLIFECAGELGWEKRPKDDHQSKLLRGMLIAMLGMAGHEPTVNEARERFSRAISDLDTLDPDLRGAVYRIVAEHGGEAEYDNLLSLYRKAKLQEERNRLFVGLASFRRPELLQRSLEMLFSDDVRSQDIYIYLRPLGANPFAAQITWRFAKERWNEFCRVYEKGRLLAETIPAICSGLSTLEDEADVRSFFEVHPVPDATRTIKQVLESIRISAKLYSRERNSLAQYFSR